METKYLKINPADNVAVAIVAKLMREFRLDATGFRRWEGS